MREIFIFEVILPVFHAPFRFSGLQGMIFFYFGVLFFNIIFSLFFLGMIIMAYLLLSKNMMMKTIIEMFDAETSIDEINKDGNN